MTKHFYTFVQTVSTPRGMVIKLRRDDGKRVTVSRQRFNILSNEGRLISSKEAEK